MMYFRTFLLIFIFSSKFATATIPTAVVVKVFSHPCILETAEYAGSGTLFNLQNNTYLITSEHVVLHKNEGICHSYLDDNRKISLKLINADWGYGLALLKSSQFIESLQSFDTLFDFNPVVGNPVELLGYPRRTKQLVNDLGHILLSKSSRPVIALIENLIEVKGAHIEFGMSGGAALSSPSKKYLGLISHQAVVAVADAASLVGEIGVSRAISDHAFIIPAQVVRDWILTTLDQATPLPSFTRNASIQVLENREVVFSRGLKFEGIGLSPGGSVGGLDGVGKKGALDGVGKNSDLEKNNFNKVGFGRDKEPKEKLLQPIKHIENSLSPLCFSKANFGVKISLDSDNLKTAITSSKEDWFISIRSRLLLGKSLCVTQFIKQTGSEMTNVWIQNLSHFFQLLLNPELVPVTYQWNTDSMTLEDELQLSRKMLGQMGNTLLKQVSELETISELSKSIEATAFLISLRRIAMVLVSETPEILSPEVVSSLSSPTYQLGREKIFSADFDLMVEVMGLIPQVGTVLRKSRLQ